MDLRRRGRGPHAGEAGIRFSVVALVVRADGIGPEEVARAAVSAGVYLGLIHDEHEGLPLPMKRRQIAPFPLPGPGSP